MADHGELEGLLSRAEALEAADDWEQAVAAYGEVAEGYRDVANSVTRAGALGRRVCLLTTHHRRAEAIAAADQFVSEFGDVADEGVTPHLASVLYWRAGTLASLGRAEDAVHGYEDLTARFGEATDPYAREYVATGLLRAASVLESIGRPADASEVYERLIRLFGPDVSERWREQVWQAMYGRAGLLGGLGRTEEALSAYDDLGAALPDSDAEDITLWVMRALAGRAATLESLGRQDEALLVLDAAIDRLGEDPGRPALLRSLAAALHQKSDLLYRLADFDEAIEVYDHIADLARLHPELRGSAVIALSNKLAMLNRLGRVEDAMAAHEQLMTDFGEDVLAALEDTIRENADPTEFSQREALAAGLSSKAAALAWLGRPTEAIAALTQLINALGDETREPVAQAVQLARQMREEAMREHPQSDDEPL